METKEKKAAHSPLPWKALPERLHEGLHVAGRAPRIHAADGREVASVMRYGNKPGDPISEANTAIIVRAVNNHEELVGALQIAVEALSKLRGHSEIAHDACERILRKTPVAFRRAANIHAKLDLFEELMALLEHLADWENRAQSLKDYADLARALLAKIKG